MDFTDMNDEELTDALAAIQIELYRREMIARLPLEAQAISEQWAEVTGRTDGDEWVQPTGAHDAYIENAIVEHNDKTWISLIPANVWEPGVSGWREETEEGDGPPEWVQPTGGHDAYTIGDQVTFEGSVYESLITGNTWSPTGYPAGWKLIT